MTTSNPSTSTPLGRLLFIDDDLYYAKNYEVTLRSRFIVQVYNKAAQALDALEAPKEFCAVVLDVMMPPPRGFASATDEGNLTGIWILKKRKMNIIKWSLPIVLLTHRATDLVQEELNKIAFPEGLVTIIYKTGTTAEKICRHVEAQARHWAKIA